MEKIIRRCGWCGRILGEKPADGAAIGKYGTETHGMCADCQDKFYRDYKDYKNGQVAAVVKAVAGQAGPSPAMHI